MLNTLSILPPMGYLFNHASFPDKSALICNRRIKTSLGEIMYVIFSIYDSNLSKNCSAFNVMQSYSILILQRVNCECLLQLDTKNVQYYVNLYNLSSSSSWTKSLPFLDLSTCQTAMNTTRTLNWGILKSIIECRFMDILFNVNLFTLMCH